MAITLAVSTNIYATSILKQAYQKMCLIRFTEESLLELYSKGLIHGTIHTCIGQEAIAFGVIEALNKEIDIICSNHRCHGHFISYCDDAYSLIAEIMGKPQGVCAGIGGSQHLHKKNFYSNGILGSVSPIAAGMALAEKINKTNAIVVQFLGDGAMGEGAVYESFNMASLWKLPILFVIEHNQYAQSTPTHLEHGGDLERRGVGFGIPVVAVDGNDVMEVYETTTKLIHKIRSQEGPQILFAHTYRLAPHSKGDDTRDPEEIQLHKKRDPLVLLANQLDPAWEQEQQRIIQQEVSNIVDSLC